MTTKLSHTQSNLTVLIFFIDLYCINHKDIDTDITQEIWLKQWEGHKSEIKQDFGGSHTLGISLQLHIHVHMGAHTHTHTHAQSLQGFCVVGCWADHNTSTMQRSRRRSNLTWKTPLMWPWHDTHTPTQASTHIYALTSLRTSQLLIVRKRHNTHSYGISTSRLRILQMTWGIRGIFSLYTSHLQ